MLSFHILPGHLSYWRSELGITLAVPVGLVAAELLYGWGGVNHAKDLHLWVFVRERSARVGL